MPPILLVEDRESLRTMLRSTLESEGFSVEEAGDGKSALDALASGRHLAVVTDLRLPGASGHDVLRAARAADARIAVIVMTAYGTVEDAVGAMKDGAFDFLAKPVDPDHLILLLRRAAERRALLEENLLLKKEFSEKLGFPRIVGDSPTLMEVSRQIQKAAPSEATVLLLGESGTGKELFARAVHHLSPRGDAPFVAINCAAIPETLLENELFGHEKGAYTGAGSMRPGRVELADSGTLFLDEIGDLGPGVQAKLLRVLQERAFERVGGNRTLSVDIRIVAATNRDLRRAVDDGRFREDLFFRLAVVPITIPPLRDRAEDIAALAAHFLERYRREIGNDELEFSSEAIEAMRQHPWPGNVRELENCIERTAILVDGSTIEPHHLGLVTEDAHQGDLQAFERVVGSHGSLDDVARRAKVIAETLVIRRALEAAGGNKTRAATLLEVNYKRLLARIQELGLEVGQPS
jgi:DNA-binding NtrC family response regulator